MDIELSGKLSGYNQGLVDSCNMVKQIITANYAEDLLKLGRYIKSKMIGSVVNIDRQEFIKPLANTVVSAAASSKIGEQIIKAANDVKDKFTSSSNLVKDQYNSDGNIQNQQYERTPIDLEKTIRKSGVGTNPKGFKHRVRDSETIWGITKEYGMTEAELMKANPKLKMYQNEKGLNIVDIRPGDQIFIPAKYAPVVNQPAQQPEIGHSIPPEHAQGIKTGSCPRRRIRSLLCTNCV